MIHAEPHTHVHERRTCKCSVVTQAGKPAPGLNRRFTFTFSKRQSTLVGMPPLYAFLARNIGYSEQQYEAWRVSSMGERCAYGKQYLYGRGCLTPESCDAVEALLRIELLERIKGTSSRPASG